MKTKLTKRFSSLIVILGFSGPSGRKRFRGKQITKLLYLLTGSRMERLIPSWL